MGPSWYSVDRDSVDVDQSELLASNLVGRHHRCLFSLLSNKGLDTPQCTDWAVVHDVIIVMAL